MPSDSKGLRQAARFIHRAAPHRPSMRRKVAKAAATLAHLSVENGQLERERDQCLDAAGNAVVRAERADDRAESTEAKLAGITRAMVAWQKAFYDGEGGP